MVAAGYFLFTIAAARSGDLLSAIIIKVVGDNRSFLLTVMQKL
jgi:hypothetical protein